MEFPSPHGAVTRSGRRSVPVLDFWRTERKAAESYASGWQRPRMSTEDELCVSTESEASSTREEPRDSLPAHPGRATIMGDVSNRAIAVAISQEQKAAAGGLDTPRDAPILDWWRSQRLTETPDRCIVGAAELSQDQLAPQRHTNTNAVGVGSRPPEPKTVVREAAGEEAPWTKAQLLSLRRAQVRAVPSTSDFWEVVAGKVEGKGPRQCQKKWFEHFATPRGRPRNASKRNSIHQRTDSPLSACTSRLAPDASAAVHHSPASFNQVPERCDVDDLFQATPMRGRRRFGVQPRGEELDPKTPRTPAGPGAPSSDTSALDTAPTDGEADFKREVSKTYVKALSKKMRRAAIQSSRKSSSEAATRFPSSGVSGRTTHVTAVSRGHELKASVSSSGAVSIASTCISDEESSSISDGVESDGE